MVEQAATTPPSPKKSSIGKIVLIGLAVFVAIVGVLSVIVAMQPATFEVSRQATIAAPPEVVFNQVNDFHKWDAWSPWAKLDPQAKNTFEGPESGKGAAFHWEGNNEVGKGRMTITESRPAELVLLDLEFVKPFASKCVTEFTFKPEGDQTLVTWTMKGENNFMSKAMHLVMNMDKMVGGSFDEGLASMKKISEEAAKQ